MYTSFYPIGSSHYSGWPSPQHQHHTGKHQLRTTPRGNIMPLWIPDLLTVPVGNHRVRTVSSSAEEWRFVDAVLMIGCPLRSFDSSFLQSAPAENLKHSELPPRRSSRTNSRRITQQAFRGNQLAFSTAATVCAIESRLIVTCRYSTVLCPLCISYFASANQPCCPPPKHLNPPRSRQLTLNLLTDAAPPSPAVVAGFNEGS